MRYLGSFILLGVLAGCGQPSGPELYDVSGAVTLDGQPVKNGEVVFRAEDGQGQTAAGKIVDGRYELKAGPGAKRVEISSMQKVPGAVGAPGTPGDPVSDTNPADVLAESIPAKYNSDSELKAEVAANNDNVFDYTLTTSSSTKP